jgi:DNA-binding NarL/FixJ family response regulator
MMKSCADLNVSLEAFSPVVEAVYDCALDPSRWEHAVCAIAELLQSQRCTLGVHDYANGCNDLMFQLGWDDQRFWQLHEEKYTRINPFFADFQLMPVGSVTIQSSIIDDAEFFETTYYREWVRPQGLRDMIALKALQTGQRTALLVANRTESEPRYGEAEIRLLTLLSPHVCRALTISDALSLKTIRCDAFESTLNMLATAVYLADRHGRVVFLNRAAERQAKTSNALRIENNRILPSDRTARTALANALASATAEEDGDEHEAYVGGFTVALPDGENAGLVATILPLERGERRNVYSAHAAMAAIFVQDPVVVLPLPGEAFAKLYRLTGSELRVLLAMAPGLGVKEVAEMLGISETTVKTHLQHIYAKTGTAKQTELLHLFLNSAPPVCAEHKEADSA